MADESETIADLRARINRAEASLNEITRRTTFLEYLKLVHEHCALQIRHDPKSSRNTTGGVTNPRDRIAPTVIAPWDSFEEEQVATYRELCEVFQDKRLFPNEAEVIGAQRTINDFLITSEQALATFTNVAQVVPAKEILNQYLNLGVLTNNPSGLAVRFSPRDDPDEDTQAAFAPVDGSWDCDGVRSLEGLKPPHKLPVESLQKALDDGTGHARKIIETKLIINSSHVVNDATYIVTAVFTQVFDYMIESGTTRAYLNTGMAYVFFDIRELEPTKLYYNLVIPPRTNTAHPADTSVCQLVMFICRCLSIPKRDADWIRNAVESNARFLVDPGAQLNLMSSPLSSASEVVIPSKEDYKPPKRRRAKSSPEADRSSRIGEQTSDDDNDKDLSPSRPPPATRSRTRERNILGAADASPSAGCGNGFSTITRSVSTNECTLCAPPNAARRYCSQTCLRGLMYSFWMKGPRKLDLECPNVARHSQSLNHHLNSDGFRESLRQQLARSHTHAIEHLGLSGGSGHCFAITLCSHGYTFVGKGSRLDKFPALAHEADIYKAIQPLQGQCIPVCLGLFELEGPYYLRAPNHLTHFLLLSYGGIRMSCEPKFLPSAEEMISSIKMALTSIHGFNVLHHDPRVENFLWNTELHRAMIIDFGESTLPDITNAAPSRMHRLFSVQQRSRGMVRSDVSFRSSASLPNYQKTEPHHKKSTMLIKRRQQELDAVETEVLRWILA